MNIFGEVYPNKNAELPGPAKISGKMCSSGYGNENPMSPMYQSRQFRPAPMYQVDEPANLRNILLSEELPNIAGTSDELGVSMVLQSDSPATDSSAGYGSLKSEDSAASGCHQYNDRERDGATASNAVTADSSNHAIVKTDRIPEQQQPSPSIQQNFSTWNDLFNYLKKEMVSQILA
jgi:hypothetical protein